MRSILDYINKGILDRVKSKEPANHIGLVEEFVKNNYDVTGKLRMFEVLDKIMVECADGKISVKNTDMEYLTNGMFAFAYVKTFNCSKCKNLKSLEGAPKTCDTFDCSFCSTLKSLDGCPTQAKQFYCVSCGKKFTESQVKKRCKVTGAILR